MGVPASHSLDGSVVGTVADPPACSTASRVYSQRTGTGAAVCDCRITATGRIRSFALTLLLSLGLGGDVASLSPTYLLIQTAMGGWLPAGKIAAVLSGNRARDVVLDLQTVALRYPFARKRSE